MEYTHSLRRIRHALPRVCQQYCWRQFFGDSYVKLNFQSSREIFADRSQRASNPKTSRGSFGSNSQKQAPSRVFRDGLRFAKRDVVCSNAAVAMTHLENRRTAFKQPAHADEWGLAPARKLRHKLGAHITAANIASQARATQHSNYLGMLCRLGLHTFNLTHLRSCRESSGMSWVASYLER